MLPSFGADIDANDPWNDPTGVRLAATITDKIPIPTIGIGAGNKCDGQVLVTADLLGLSARKPPFAKSYVNLRQIITTAVQDFTEEVQNKQFPQS